MSDGKVPDSGMPDETYWNQLMDIPAILEWLNIAQAQANIVEFGCGYGSFTLPLAQLTRQPVISFDIEPAMVQLCQQRCQQAQLNHVQLIQRDLVNEGSNLPDSSADLVLIFNLLHGPHNQQLVTEASRLLTHKGRIAILHWRNDIPTPRGPAIETRPDLSSIQKLCQKLPLQLTHHRQAIGPYHWGVQLIRV